MPTLPFKHYVWTNWIKWTWQHGMDYKKMGGKQEDILFLKLKPERFIFIFTWLSGHVPVDIIYNIYCYRYLQTRKYSKDCLWIINLLIIDLVVYIKMLKMWMSALRDTCPRVTGVTCRVPSPRCSRSGTGRGGAPGAGDTPAGSQGSAWRPAAAPHLSSQSCAAPSAAGAAAPAGCPRPAGAGSASPVAVSSTSASRVSVWPVIETYKIYYQNIGHLNILYCLHLEIVHK